MKYQNETTVKSILSLEATALKDELKSLELIGKIRNHKTPELRLKIHQDFFQYLKEIKTIIKNNKLKPSSKIAISFTPQLKQIKKDEFGISKLGGIPFCFLNQLKNNLKDKTKCFKILRKVYPKNLDGQYFNFIGDIESKSPTFFMNEVMSKIVSNKKRYNSFYIKNHYSLTTRSSIGSLFIDQNPTSMSSPQTSGRFISLEHIEISDFENEEIELYMNYLNEFIKNEIKNETYSIDNFELTQIVSWSPQVEIMNKNYSSVETLSNTPKNNNLMKIFGFPESQQSIYPYYCTDGSFGPRLLTPFITIQNDSVDTTVQVYADLFILNQSSEDTGFLKVDISST